MIFEQVDCLLPLLSKIQPINLILMKEEACYNPILNQLKNLKQKLSQKGKIIQILTECIQTQEKALISIVQQFEEHESKIMKRLNRLEEINLRYIKDYLEIKKQNKVEDFIPINRIFANDAKSYISKKIQYVKMIQNEDKKAKLAQSQTKKMVDDCLSLMKVYLTDRKINYDKLVSTLSDERKRKMKQSKGLEGYRQNKQEAKFIEELKKKIEKFGKRMNTIDNKNSFQIFNQRQQIESDIARLDPSKAQISIEDSQAQQRMFRSIIQQIITSNDSSQVEEYLLEGSLNFIQDKVEILSNIYGLQYVNQSIKSIQDLSGEEKINIINNNQRVSKKSIKSMAKINESSNPRQDSREYVNSPNYNSQNPTISGDYAQNSNQMKLKKKYMSNASEEDIEAAQEDNQQLNISSMGSKAKAMNKQSKVNDKLNNKFEKTMAKTFFQQQEKSRDELISLQNTQIQEHQKVIDKLITFIKKEFKEKKMEDIDGDDPEQLIGYYFQVNQKKHADIREEVQILQKEKVNTANKIHTLTFQNSQLNAKLDELTVQMDELMKKYEKSSFQLHILISRTEDLVKISLQALINTCMNNITPQELILQLERIIDLIKQNIQKKRAMTYKFTITSEIIANNQEKINSKEFISVNREVQPGPAGQLEDVNCLHLDKSEVYDHPIQLEQQHSFKNTDNYPKIDQSKSKINFQIKQSSILNLEESLLKLNSNKASMVLTQKPQKNSEGFDEKYINSIQQQIEIIKDRNLNQHDELYDMNEMYSKYKQALDCLERAQNINKQNELKYQKFVNGLKRKHAWQCPQKLEEKLFYMEKLIAEQNELLQNQRAEYEQTILKQVNQSEMLAQSILKKFKLKRRETKM